MLCSYIACAVNRQGDRIQGAKVYLVPYSDGSCNPSDAIFVYSDREGTQAAKEFFTDADGNAFLWVPAGEYSVCTEKNGIQSVIPFEKISCGDEESVVETKTSIHGEEEFQIPFDGDLVSVKVIDKDGNQVFPQCDAVNGRLVIKYAADCIPDQHTVCISAKPVTASVAGLKIKINGVEIPPDAQGCININISDGGSNLVSVSNGGISISSLRNCDNEIIDVRKPVLQTCLTELLCGYVGDKICDEPTIGQIDESETQSVINFQFSGASGQLILAQSAPDGVMVVGTPVVSGMFLEVPVQLSNDAKVDYNALIDKTGLPTVDSCTSPLAGDLQINGLVGDEGGSQITKAVGGMVEFVNMDAIQGNVYETRNNAASEFTDVVDAHHFGGDSEQVEGSTFTGSVQVFDGSTQNIIIRLKTCYFLPDVAEYSAKGDYVSGIDANGNSVNESDHKEL